MITDAVAVGLELAALFSLSAFPLTSVVLFITVSNKDVLSVIVTAKAASKVAPILLTSLLAHSSASSASTDNFATVGLLTTAVFNGFDADKLSSSLASLLRRIYISITAT